MKRVKLHPTKSLQLFEKHEVRKVNHVKKVSYGFIDSSMLYGDNSDSESEQMPKGKEFILKNLAKFGTMRIQKFFYHWKTSSAIVQSQKLYTMISTLHRIFLTKGKRVFHPPRIIKDADEIMTRTIKKIIQIKNRLLDSSLYRWKIFRTALYTKEKAVVFYRACQVAGHCFRDAFYMWREKTLARESIKRTTATQMFRFVLNKCFRGRFKLFVFKTYMRVGPKQAVGRVFTLLSQKYLENNRLAFRKWALTIEAWDMQKLQLVKDTSLANMLNIWNRYIVLRLKKAFSEFMRNNKPLKIRLVRTLVNAYKGKKYRCWVKWIREANGYRGKFKALKMETALKRATRKFQKAGFSVFISKINFGNEIQCLKDLYFNRLRFGFNRIRLKAKNSEIWTQRQLLKNLKVDFKILKNRNRKIASKCFEGLLVKLVKPDFETLSKVAQEKKLKAKYSLEVITKTFTKKTTTILRKWKRTSNVATAKIAKNSANGFKIHFKIGKFPLKNLRLAFQQIMASESRVKSAVRVFFSKIEKRSSLALRTWKNYSEKVNENKLLNAVKTQKLRNALMKIPNRTLKIAFSRIVTSESRSKAAVRTVIKQIIKKPKIVFKLWKMYISSCKNKSLLDNYRSSKVKSTLYKLTSKSCRGCFTRIIGEGNLIKGAIKKIVSCLDGKKANGWALWKIFIMQCKSKAILNNANCFKLKGKMQGMIIRRERDTFKRIVGDGNAVKGAIQSVMAKIIRRPKGALKAWSKYVLDSKEKVLLTNCKSEKLRNALGRIPRRMLKNVFQRIIGNGNACAGALRAIFIALTKKKSLAFMKYKEFNEFCKKKLLLTNLKSQKLRQSLSRIPLRTLCLAFSIVTRPHNYISKRLKSLNQVFLSKFTHFFQYWKLKFYKAQAKKRSIKSISHIYKQKLQQTLSKYKTSIHNKSQNLILRSLKGQKLHLSLQKLIRKRFNTFKLRLLNKPNETLVKLTLISLKYFKKPREVLKAWKEYVFKVKKGILLDRMRSEKLKVVISRISSRTFSIVTRTILLLPVVIRKFFRICLQNHRENLKKTLRSWSKYVDRCKQGQLLDSVRTEKLRKHLVNINRRHIRDAIERVLGDGSRVKGSLRRMMFQIHKCKMLSLQKWKDWFMRTRAKEAERKIKGFQLKIILRKVPDRTLRSAVDRVIGNGTRAIGAIRRMMAHIKSRCNNAFHIWKDFLSMKKERDMKRAIKLKSLTDLIMQRTSRIMIDSIIGDCRIRRLLTKLVNNYKIVQKNALDLLWGRVEKIRTIRKVNSAYFVFKTLVALAKKVVTARFMYWKNLEYLRKRRIIRKTLGKLIQNTSISYEIGFWKWKFVISRTGTQLNPKHSLFFKRLFIITSNYTNRLTQFALFKIVLNFKAHPMSVKLNLPKTLASMMKGSPDNEMMFHTPETKIRSKLEFYDDFSTVSTVQSALNKDNTLRIKQKGAVQVLYFDICKVVNRKMSVVFASLDAYVKKFGVIDQEKSRLVQQINELRYEKHSLLEDNNTLRVHNDTLISRLEKNTLDIQQIHLNLDLVKIASMVKIVKRQVDLVSLAAFHMIASISLN
ncbi:hypothetical protein SteCoe_20206 [Stentor coeruleus]|uniref:Uncharacterized protein n=1 Tax=Stentor coeruleus TaxID=5963 RepID=A0A1R2BSK1_9CILI|nr:hypothetical protein SteCoe_20206 [Stentor coeruleus]